jgi:hypothetical protein
MPSKFIELPVPQAVHKASEGIEILRVWVADRKQHVSLQCGIWEDPAAWGIMLVDLIKHIGRAYNQQNNINFQDTIARVKNGFDVEWENATDNPSGNIIDG